MKKIIVILAILLCATLAYADNGNRTISVTGSGEVEVAPDTGSINLGFRSQNADLATAKAEMTARMDALVKSLQQFNISEKDIQATQLFIYPNYTTTSDGKEVFQSYQVSRSITVIFKDLTQTDAILDASIKAGANTFNGLNFSYSKEQELRQDAVVKAIENAKSQAGFLAQNFGVKLGKVQTITTSAAFNVRSEMAVMQDRANAGGTGYVPGQVKVNAQVSVVYAIDEE